MSHVLEKITYGSMMLLALVALMSVWISGISCKHQRTSPKQFEDAIKDDFQTSPQKQFEDAAKDDLQKTTPKQSAAAPSKSPCLDKSTRTSAQKKIDSQLLCAAYPPPSHEFLKPQLRTDGEGRVLVDIRSQVTDDLLSRIRNLGGLVVSTSPRYRTILSYFPLDKLERLAESEEVSFIMPAAEATTNR